LRLADRAATWKDKPENRFLPAWWEWLTIRFLTKRRDWTLPQRKMMGKATRYYAARALVALVLVALLGWGLVEGYGTLCAYVLRDRLMNVPTKDVPVIVDDMPAFRRWLDPLLHDAYGMAEATRNEHHKLRASLALLPVDAAQGDYLGDRLLTAEEPDEVQVIRSFLRDHAPDSAKRFWPVLQNDEERRPRRLRAACALARFDPDDPRWAKVGDEVVRGLAGENLLLLREWAELLEPVRAHLVSHQVRRLLEADAANFATFLTMLRAYPEDAIAALHPQLERDLPATANVQEKLVLAQQKAAAAVALLLLGRSERVWPLFHQDKDPTCRTYLIHLCAARAVDPAILARRLLDGEEKDLSSRQGLLLALGEYNAEQRLEVAREPLMEYLLKDYRDEPDSGLCGATDWLLRQWGQAGKVHEMDRALATGKIEGKRHWYVNGEGQMFAVIAPPGQFEVGSPVGEKNRDPRAEDRRVVRIDYSYVVAVKLVTVAEFKRFRAGFAHNRQISASPDTPINNVSWYDAAAYCNWLSEREKIPKDEWCYEPNDKGEYATGMKIKANYQNLSGYRLPREVEWEYACRAGTATAWSHGSAEEMLTHYGWIGLNSHSIMQPVGALKPNGFGLFDVHGNAWQWCQEAEVLPIAKDVLDVKEKDPRTMRGGSFLNVAWNARSASRERLNPSTRNVNTGFRLVRTQSLSH
jgi:formylglycine-generating enzyme required for sulfatase activity